MARETLASPTWNEFEKLSSFTGRLNAEESKEMKDFIRPSNKKSLNFIAEPYVKFGDTSVHPGQINCAGKADEWAESGFRDLENIVPIRLKENVADKSSNFIIGDSFTRPILPFLQKIPWDSFLFCKVHYRIYLQSYSQMMLIIIVKFAFF